MIKKRTEKRNWYAVYTKPRAEKKVEAQLKKYDYIVYLPLKKELRQWKDRRKKVNVPLFNSYIFVRVNEKEYYEIPKLVYGFVKYVTIGGERVVVREKEISNIKNLLSHDYQNIEVSNEQFLLYDDVTFKIGKLKGLKGKLVEFRGKYKVAVRIESLGTNLLVSTHKNALKKAGK